MEILPQLFLLFVLAIHTFNCDESQVTNLLFGVTMNRKQGLREYYFIPRVNKAPESILQAKGAFFKAWCWVFPDFVFFITITQINFSNFKDMYIIVCANEI